MDKNNFEKPEYKTCAEWIAAQIKAGKSWDDISHLCSDEDIVSKLEYLINEEMWPDDMNVDIWAAYVMFYRENYIPVKFIPDDPLLAIDNGEEGNGLIALGGISSAWDNYEKSLRGKMSLSSIADIRRSCEWILNHLKRDTRDYGPVKGLVMGSVQSGKTANMCGLISMAADYDWNLFIVLSGTIDNLRIQTRERFRKDLKDSEGGVIWRMLDFTAEDKHTRIEELKLNSLSGSKEFANRYFTVCLKNRRRLESLIEWLYENDIRTRRLRIVVIDDEADQASINTAEIVDDEEEQERRAINQLIINLVNGKKADGSTPTSEFQAMNYISYTATPYANVLNESSEISLYPKDFICSLPEASEYFGPNDIFGNDEKEHPELGIVRDIPSSDKKQIDKISDSTLPESMKKAVAWFLCVSSVLRLRGYKKSISMLVHTSSVVKQHLAVYEKIRKWLSDTDEVMTYCASIYAQEAYAVTKQDLMLVKENYGLIDSIDEEMPPYEDIIPELMNLLGKVSNIILVENEVNKSSTLDYHTGIHLCVDNCRANRYAEDGTYLRIMYPKEEQLIKMEKAPVFIVIGGNTLSRGLTIEGLVCTYFSRESNQADTLMQMARWFGYRKNFELLQRIWMTESAQKKYRALAKIDTDLKEEIRMFMEHGISPSQLGPRIRNTPEIKRFLITAKKKQQRAEFEDFDFSGYSGETTAFDNDESLAANIAITTSFLKKISEVQLPRKSTVANAYVWDRIPYEILREMFLDRYVISAHSSLADHMEEFRQWIDGMNSEGALCNWNIAVANGDNHGTEWEIFSGVMIGCVERTCKKGKDYIDIGSLRSGRDAICDVDESKFTTQQAEEFKKTRKNGKEIIAKRTCFNLKDIPLLLIYRIKKNGGVPKTSNRTVMDSLEDIIGISIIVSGESIGENHAKSLRIKI